MAARGRPECDGPCLINIAFVYGDDVLDPSEHQVPVSPDPDVLNLVSVTNIGELRDHIASWVDYTTTIWRENGLNAELRFVGMARHARLKGAKATSNGGWDVHVQRFKERFDAHLVYSILPATAGNSAFAFLGHVRPADGWRPEDPYYVRDDFPFADGALPLGSLVAMAHEIGHNLGLVHDPAQRAEGREGQPVWRGGQGYCGGGISTIMAYCFDLLPISVLYFPDEVDRFSTSAATFTSSSGKEYTLGKKGVHESVEVLRWNIPRLAQPPAPEDVITPEPPEPEDAPCSPFDWSTQAKHTFDHGFEVYGCFEWEEDGGLYETSATDYGLDARESALFYFFERDNAEILIKVLDACGVNGHRWVFVAPVTTLAFNLEVREVATGKTWAYGNPRGGKTAQPRGDTTAFPCDATAASWATRPALGGGAASVGPVRAGRDLMEIDGQAAETGGAPDCEPGAPALTLSGGYRVGMCYETYSGQVGEARDFGLDSSQSALLYFFKRDNVEVLIKVLDGCGVNDHRWVFVAPVTDLAFNLYVESPDGQRWLHTNRLGKTASAASDVAAFPCASESTN